MSEKKDTTQEQILFDDDENEHFHNEEENESSSSEEDEGDRLEDTKKFVEFVKKNYEKKTETQIISVDETKNVEKKKSVQNDFLKGENEKNYLEPSKNLLKYVTGSKQTFNEEEFLSNYVLKGKWKDDDDDDDDDDVKMEVAEEQDVEYGKKRKKKKKKGERVVRTVRVFSTLENEENEVPEYFTSERDVKDSRSKKRRRRRKERIAEEKEKEKKERKVKKKVLQNEIFGIIKEIKYFVKNDGSAISSINFKNYEKLECEKEDWKLIEKNKVLNEIFYPSFDEKTKSNEEISLRKQLFLKFRKYYDLFGRRKVDDFSKTKYRYEEVQPDRKRKLMDILEDRNEEKENILRKRKYRNFKSKKKKNVKRRKKN